MYKAIDVLLIEDNPSDAKLIIRTLQKNNLSNDVVHLKDGAEALDFIFARGAYISRNPTNKPKVILLDLKMPRVNGFEVLKAIKSNENTLHIPVIVMSSSKAETDIAASYKLGANSYIVKPMEFETFSKTVTCLGMYWLKINQG